MDFRSQTLEELKTRGATLSGKRALVGFDGFVDKIMSAVDSRSGPGDKFTAIENIEQFGQRITAAAGKSTNIEVYPHREKIGGNGPIMANALISGGVKTMYIGALGMPSVQPVFESFARAADAVSVGEPGITNAIEFKDGKIMISTTASLDEVTYESIVAKMGEGPLFDTLSRADLVALVNWTMLPHMTAILNALLEKVLPHLGPAPDGRFFFFDLADPEKRSDGDIAALLTTLRRFTAHGSVTLGLNLKEAQRIAKVLGHPPLETDSDGLRRLAQSLRSSLEISTVVVHPRDSAACATKDATWWAAGPYTETPLVSTGAGDHFNAGFSIGQLIGVSPPACLTMAVAASGYYVNNGKSPSLFEIDTFIRNW